MAIIESIVISLVVAAVSIVLSELLRPKPKLEDARPAGQGDFQFPTAIEGRPLPVPFGTVKISGPNVVWWGDTRARKIEEKVKTGLWSSKKFTKGFEYSVGLQLGLCTGRVDEVSKWWVGEDVAASGSVQDGTYDVDAPFFFGGPNSNGGMVGTLRVHSGSGTQTANSYLSSFQSPVVPLRHTCYVVWEGGTIGHQPSLKPWAFEIKRFPNQLGLTGGDHIVNSADANPAAVLYELLTDTDWGYGYPASDIDVTNFRSIGATLATEGNGFSMILDREIDSLDFLQEVQRQIDGVVYLDREDGLFKISLARDDYDVDLIRQISDTNIVDVREFTRGTWDDTSNQVRIEFVDRDRDYFGTFAQAHSLGNQNIQGGELVSVTRRYPGVKDKTLANKLATRELRSLAVPLAKGTIVVDRTLWDVKPNEVLAWTDTNLGFTKLPVRVVKIDDGDLENGNLTLSVVQDVFKFTAAIFADNDSTLWTPPEQGVQEFIEAEQLVIEAPYALIVRDPEFPTLLDRLWAGTARNTGNEVTFQIYQRNAAGTPSGTYTEDSDDIPNFLFLGALTNDVSPEAENGAATIDVDADFDATVAELQAAFSSSPSAQDIGQNFVNVLYIGGDNPEFIGVTSSTNMTTFLRLNNVWRGLMDTVAGTHSAGDPVFWMFMGGDLNQSGITAGNNVEAQLRAESFTDETTEGEATEKTLTMGNRARRPYPPVRLTVNSSSPYPASEDIDTQRPSTSSLDDRGFEVGYIRRDYRTIDETFALTNDASTFSGDFPSANTTQYKGEFFLDASALNADLEAMWKLGEASGTRLDETANDNDLADNNTVGQEATGKIGAAASFVRANSEYLSIADNASLSFGDEGMTGTCWVRFDVNNVTQGVIAKWDRTGNDREYTLLFVNSTGFLRFAVSNDGTAATTVDASSVSIAINTWYFVRFWHDPVANVIGIQLDDGTKHTAAHTTGINDGASQFDLGRSETGAGFEYLDGDLDAVTIHRRVLTDAEASALYNSGSGREPPYSSISLFTVDFADTAEIFFSRTKILRELAGVLPSTVRAQITARHTFEGTVYEAQQALDHSWDLDASTLDNDTNLGVLQQNDVSASYTAPDTGTYTFNIGTSVLSSGAVEARINGGGWSTVIATSNTTGTLAGVTASDTIEVRHTQPTITGETFLEVVPPTSTAGAYGVLIQ